MNYLKLKGDKMLEDKKAVVFAGDYGYIRQIETALKSLCYHNSGLKVYIFNQDIPHIQ